jgi:hypothetical protein
LISLLLLIHPDDSHAFPGWTGNGWDMDGDLGEIASTNRVKRAVGGRKKVKASRLGGVEVVYGDDFLDL